MKIICVGRNYVDHIKELDNKRPDSPVIFLKPETSIIHKKQPFFIPNYSNNIQFEVEIIVQISRLGRSISPQFSHKYYNEIGLGIDFTARDIQNDLKKNGLPWEKAKGFDGSAQISKEFINKKSLKLEDINFSLNLNNSLMQKGNSNNMIFSFDQIISYISKYFTLRAGDLIYTGTPSGVGKVEIGDSLSCFINGREMLKVNIK